ncbi:hypothetical protein [Alicyclobacillus mengziensis]|uniref:Uncharacterized protein n=1 Tax=Alicyclobacillus mengziensis TaxID=2931921 RepID=A0A9X7Z5U9_9BACL|nr:hypothetical protein [Alicyclobacillus mengziensis]QSO47269.1 hypothetical protein JZ786_23225 [Alicyclobacillus mengziensis]
MNNAFPARYARKPAINNHQQPSTTINNHRKPAGYAKTSYKMQRATGVTSVEAI